MNEENLPAFSWSAGDQAQFNRAYAKWERRRGLKSHRFGGQTFGGVNRRPRFAAPPAQSSNSDQ